MSAIEAKIGGSEYKYLEIMLITYLIVNAFIVTKKTTN
jgi:hypothetical protein